MDTTVESPRALYTGTLADGARVFHSVPYCRFPEPFGPAEELPKAPAEPAEVDARRARPEAVALTLAAPESARFGSDLPVVVFIHGGAYHEGSHEDFDMGVLARRGVVGVSIDYRLDAQGFVRFHDDEPDRYRGVDDCLTALKWLQREIEHFGGDPGNITLAGQSAGAGICLWLTRTDHYQGLFRRVWALSPAFPRVPFDKRKGTLRRIQGTPVTRRHFTRRLERHPRALARGMRRFRARYFHDLALGPAPFDAHELAEVPVLVSCTRDELYNESTTARIDRAGFGGFAVKVAHALFGLQVPAGSYLDAVAETDPDRPLSRLAGDAMIRRWAAETAEHAAGPVWLMELTGTKNQPAVHCDDLPLIFGPGTGPQGGPEAHGDHLLGLLLDYARTGEPGWPAHRRPERQAVRIDRDSGERTGVSDPLRAVRLAFQRPRWR